MHIEHTKYSLMDFITGHLDENESDRIRLHIQQCPECQNQYNELKAVSEELQHSQIVSPSSAYYSTILPRVQERLMGHRASLWSDRMNPSRFILPLTVSALFLILLIRMPSDFSAEHRQTDALFHAVKDYSPDEVVQAVSIEYAGSNVFSNQDVASAGVAEHLQGDQFIREALLKQIESDEIVDMDIDEVLSGLNREQAEQVLSGLTEREML